MSALALNFKRSKKYPYGGYSPAGEPVCYDHRQVRCYGCGELFEQHKMRRRVVGTREDRVLRHGMRPRIEEFFGSFCPSCDRNRKRGKSAKEGDPARVGSNYALYICGLLVVGFVAIFWFLLTLLKG